MGKKDKVEPKEEPSEKDTPDEPPKKPAVDVYTQTELASKQVGKEKTLNEYILCLEHDLKDKASASDEGKYEDVSEQIAREVMGELVKKLRSNADKKMISEFNPQDAQQMAKVEDGVYKARVKLEMKYPPGTLQLRTGSSHGLADNQGLVALNVAGLTKQECKAVSNAYTAFFDDEFLSPTKLNKWIDKGFQQTMGPMQGSERHDHRITLATLMNDGRVSVRINTTPRDSDDTMLTIVQVTPILPFSDWLSSASLVHPFPPRQKPYSDEGKRIVDSIMKRLEKGEKLVCMEGSVTGPNPTAGRPPMQRSKTDITPSQRPTTKQTSRQRPTTTQSGQRRPLAARPMAARPMAARPRTSIPVPSRRVWSVNLEQAEEELFNKVMKLDCMKHARNALFVFSLLEGRCPNWRVLPPRLSRTIVLSLGKQVHELKSPDQWFLAYITKVHGAIKSGKHPEYFLPRANLLAGVDMEDLKPMAKDLEWMIKNIEKQPWVLAQYIYP